MCRQPGLAVVNRMTRGRASVRHGGSVIAVAVCAARQYQRKKSDGQDAAHACASHSRDVYYYSVGDATTAQNGGIYAAKPACHSSISFTISPMPQSRSVARAAIERDMRTRLLIRAVLHGSWP